MIRKTYKISDFTEAEINMAKIFFTLKNHGLVTIKVSEWTDIMFSKLYDVDLAMEDILGLKIEIETATNEILAVLGMARNANCTSPLKLR
jgi:hypothetical protein